jgi:hypothetical protein
MPVSNTVRVMARNISRSATYGLGLATLAMAVAKQIP